MDYIFILQRDRKEVLSTLVMTVADGWTLWTDHWLIRPKFTLWVIAVRSKNTLKMKINQCCWSQQPGEATVSVTKTEV